MSLRLAGKHCAVVGATGGIGFAIAKAFANHGAVVSILGRSALDARHRLEPQLPPVSPLSPPAAAAAAAVPAEAAPLFPENSTTGATRSTHVPLTHRFLRLDVTNAEDIKTTFSSKDELRGVGHIDVLVNCAAVSQTTLLKRTPDEQLADILNTNLLSAMLICKHAKVQTNGCIINISSLMAIKGGLGATAYAASKSGLIGFTRALCREMSARSIRVNALLPGWVNTQMWTALKPELQQAYLKDTPLNRVAEPDEVADAAVFLASNGFANNCVLNLDGGLSAA